MKLGGRKLSEVNIEEIFIPRKDGDLRFIAKGVNDNSDFDKLCPQPKPPIRIKPGGERVQNVEDAAFKAANKRYADQKFAWIVIQSLRDTPDLEWEKVKLDDPNTWVLWQEEMKESGFVDAEIQRVVYGCMSANGLNEARIEEARKSFLAGMEAQKENSSSPSTELTFTPSGEPVKGST